jgi:DNA repair exonuclease SbcCD nuclease subunit
MKLIFCTDTHFSESQPRHRLDNVFETQFREFDEILELVEIHHAALIHGGDVLDKPKVSHGVIQQLLERIRYQPIYAIGGNHDLEGYSSDSLAISGLGVLYKSGWVHPLNEFTSPRDKVVIKGLPATLEIPTGMIFGDHFKDYFKIVVSHHYIIPEESMPFNFRHPRDVKTDADLWLLGHYHKAFHYSDGKTEWWNPGSIARRKIDEANQVPTVLLIDTDDRTVQPIPLRTSRPGKEIFDLSKAHAAKVQDNAMEEFAKSLQQVSFNGIDILQVADDEAKRQAISDDVKGIVLKKLTEAKEVVQ